ncbi:unnamed protein product [Linum tenue]|uniref:DM2 domain-containing protein n=1 Tax=Linum tenue TaxID=586396 RepID=A0AAV0H3T5_9ROSI|nr:unnamed protein product [Linum tenue]
MTDQEISQALHSLLHDYSTSQSSAGGPAAPLTSMTAVVKHLESRLGVDLSQKAEFIRSQLQQFLFQPPHPPLPAPPQHQQQQPFPHPPTYKDRYAPHQTPNFLLSPGFPPHSAAGAVFSPGVTVTTAVKLDSPAALAGSALDSPKESNKGKRKGGAGGLNKLCGVSPELQVIVGHPSLPRTEIVKQLWAYIRKHNLQDPSNKRKIICDDALRVVFETDCTDMFKMNKLLSKHILRLDPPKEASAKKQKVGDEEQESQGTHAAPVPSAGIPDEEKEPQGTQAPPGPSVGISEELANFFGVSERVMLQTELFSRLWAYINGNSLEDPHNSMVIQCDTKLQELFGCESLPASKIPEVLSQHHIFRT